MTETVQVPQADILRAQLTRLELFLSVIQPRHDELCVEILRLERQLDDLLADFSREKDNSVKLQENLAVANKTIDQQAETIEQLRKQLETQNSGQGCFERVDSASENASVIKVSDVKRRKKEILEQGRK